MRTPSDKISIHTPLARCDGYWRSLRELNRHFNPHTSCEVRRNEITSQNLIEIFQSTHLLRGATLIPSRLTCSFAFQSTHLLRGATSTVVSKAFAIFIFQSTHLLRGATCTSALALPRNAISIHTPLARCDSRPQRIRRHRHISIHTPLARCDLGSEYKFSRHHHFNPHTSCEVRQNSPRMREYRTRFQSTHLLRGATMSPYSTASVS